MIRVQRGAEPSELATVRASELTRVRALGHPPSSEEVGTRYQTVGDELWRRQDFKCCYCESREQRKRNDVEHFRPKARAQRAPGSTATHGYWWLAWSWQNLYFACRNCNQAPHKLDKFPLAPGSVALTPEQHPPGQEQPLIIDPGTESGIEHIQFRPRSPATDAIWAPTPRGGSAKGLHTIRVCGLDRDDLLELYTAHVRQFVRPEMDRLELGTSSPGSVHDRWAELTRRVLAPSMPYVGLSFDALDHFVPEALRAQYGLVLTPP